MPNFIEIVDGIRKEMAMHMPDGMDEQFLKKIPFLFKRIEELETALVPFARVFKVNERFSLGMLEVYKTDCKKAFDVLDSTQPYRFVTPPEEHPAE